MCVCTFSALQVLHLSCSMHFAHISALNENFSARELEPDTRAAQCGTSLLLGDECAREVHYCIAPNLMQCAPPQRNRLWFSRHLRAKFLHTQPMRCNKYGKTHAFAVKSVTPICYCYLTGAPQTTIMRAATDANDSFRWWQLTRH